MKESEFIELLNLYVDHELAPGDSARLEAEVASNPARRKTYREYCMMHKACDVLAAVYRDPQAETPRFILQQEKSTGWAWGAGLVTGGLMAAACLAIAFVLHVRQVSPVGGVNAAPPLNAVAAAVEAPAARLPTHLATAELQPVLNTRDWTNPAAVQNESLAWMNQVQLAPLQGVNAAPMPAFPAATSLLLTGDTSATAVSAQPDPQIEHVAFQFQR
jgi:anti-sigma factor RsiW